MAKAKKTSIVIRLMSMAGTGYFYTLRKNIKANPEKCAAAALRRRTPATLRTAHARDAPHRASRPTLLLSPPAHPPRFPAAPPRLMLMKFDPRVNKHVLFKEERIKK